MKSLLIERVQNGWIVRPFTPGRCDWAQGDQQEMWVFPSVELLTGFLAGYLKDPEPEPGFGPHPCSPTLAPGDVQQWHGNKREFP